jgi:hypothetical protein
MLGASRADTLVVDEVYRRQARFLVIRLHQLRRILGAGQWIFTTVAVVFLLFALSKSWPHFAETVRSARWLPLSFAIVLWALLHLLSPVFAWIVLANVGAPIPYRTALRIHVSRLPARYLPGGIWHTASRMADLNRLGVNGSQISVLVILENGLPPAIALALGCASMAIAGKLVLLSICGIACALMLLLIVSIVLRHRRLLDRQVFRTRTYFGLALLSAAFWIGAATAFTSYWFSLSAGTTSILEIGGSYLLSWVAGFFAVFAPQGIGVFEATIGALLAGAMPFASVALLAAGFRAAILIADTLAYCIFLGIRFYSRQRASSLSDSANPTMPVEVNARDR